MMEQQPIRNLPIQQDYESSTDDISPPPNRIVSDTSSSPSISTPTSTPTSNESSSAIQPPLYRKEGLLAVYKPLEWTSQDVVAYIRGILVRDAKERGILLPKSKKSPKRIKIGHGGTLDPLAEGVLVIGIGYGTQELQSYLAGSKQYQAHVTFGYETTTLDREGDIVERKSYQHVTESSIRQILPQFEGCISQIPPIFSAIRKNGKKLYQEAREGKTAEEVGLEPRLVQIQKITYLPNTHHDLDGDEEGSLSTFGLQVECGGGTYIRSLVRDIGRALETRATMTGLIRTQQGPFRVEHALRKEDWNIETISLAMETTPLNQNL